MADLTDVRERYAAAARAGPCCSLGCGNPTAAADPQAGETVLDRGSGAGDDVVVSARRVGPGGRATPEMLALARANAQAAGVSNAEFLEATSKPSRSRTDR